MSYLWSQKDLWMRVEHDSEDVQDWAVERLLDMYPESEAELLLKIPDLPSKTVNRLLSRGTGEVCPAGLLDIYTQVENPQHKAGVAALLIRHGHDVPVAPGDEILDASRLYHLSDSDHGVESYCNTTETTPGARMRSSMLSRTPLTVSTSCRCYKTSPSGRNGAASSSI
jgi:hypothetical protein